jgi:hypothetical protein
MARLLEMRSLMGAVPACAVAVSMVTANGIFNLDGQSQFQCWQISSFEVPQIYDKELALRLERY